MQLSVSKEKEIAPNLFKCSLGCFYGEEQGEVSENESFVAELDCDDVFSLGDSMNLVSDQSLPKIEACDGKTKVVGRIVEIYEEQTALLEVGPVNWIIEYEGEISKGQWVELNLTCFEVYPVLT